MKFAVDIVTRGVDYPRFRRVYHSEEFNGEVAVAAKLKERTLLEHVKLPDGTERRRVHLVPHISLPAAIQKLFQDQPFSYDEVTVFNPQTRSATFAIETPAGETIQVTGEAHFIEEGGGVRLHFDGDARVKIFGVGMLVEKFLIGEVKGRYELVQRMMQSFIDAGRDAQLTASIPVPR